MEEDKDFEGGNKVYIRGEIFDHGLFPDSAQITKSILLALFKNLHLVSSIDYKITLDQFKEEATKCIPSLKLTEAHLYFSTFKQIMRQIDKTPDLPENANKADVRCLGVFMATQIYAQTQTAMLHDETRKQYSNTMWPSLVYIYIYIYIYRQHLQVEAQEIYYLVPVRRPRKVITPHLNSK